jgi:hypothetical protein
MYKLKLEYLLSKSSSLYADLAVTQTLPLDQMIIGHKENSLFHKLDAKSLY